MSTDGPRSTRESILAAAIPLFTERGGEVRLEDVADEAGVSRQTLYLHFGSRSGLLIAMTQHMDHGGPLPDLLAQVFDAPTALDALDAVANLHAEYHPIVHHVARVLMVGRYEDEALRAAWDERMESRRNLYHIVVERLQEEGGLAPGCDIETATDILWALTSWQLWEQLVVDRGWSKDEYVTQMRAMLRRQLIPGSH